MQRLNHTIFLNHGVWSQGMEKSVDCAALNALMVAGGDIAILDVRRRSAFEAEPRLIPGAVWRKPEEVAMWANALNPNQPLVVYCVHGHEVSQGVAGHLRAHGLEAVWLDGGIEAWKASGGLVTDGNEGITP
jgi:thiosulfate sulfurtransferase